MQIEILYWHWLIFGMLLFIAEILLPSFVVFWFGLGGLIVAALLFLIPSLSFALQLLIWAISSLAFAALWFRKFKPLMADRTKAGMAREAILGESGLVIRGPEEDQNGYVRFATPLLGSEEWPFYCQQQVEVGDRVFVIEISGNTLVVEKRQ
jgi:membrane protein implicated in regulation of membrane protease activity